MTNYGQLFIESKGAPLVVNGRNVVMVHKEMAKVGQAFTVTIVSTKSKWPQGVGVSENVEVFGEKVKRAVVWEYFSLPPELRGQKKSKLPFKFDVECRSKRGFLNFYNMTEINGRQDWWHGGSAMEIIRNGNKSVIKCNDFELDDDFDDLIFEVERK